MTKLSYAVLIFLLAISLLIAWLINMDILFGEASDTITTQQQRDINECQAIAEKSVAHLKVIVPYQQLEKAGRQARVMRLCMSDRQYVQNPAWLDYATTRAAAIAKRDGQSIDETLETLKRQHMVMFTTPEHTPPYWKYSVSQNTPNNTN